MRCRELISIIWLALALHASADVHEDKDVSTEDSREPEVVGSQQPVHVFVGQAAILPCQVKSLVDVSGLTVEWKCNMTLVHVYRSMRDDPSLQHEHFRGRTSLFHNEMTRGNISLQLSSVNKSDAGNYTCFVPKLNGEVRRGYAVLIVDDRGDASNNRVHTTPAAVPDEKDAGTEDFNHKLGVGIGVGAVLVGIIGIVTVTVWNRRRRGETL